MEPQTMPRDQRKPTTAPEVEKRPILVISNRLPVTFSRGPRGLDTRRSPGGLVSALEPVLRKNGGMWIGWPGIDLRSGEMLPPASENYEIRPVRLTEAEISGHYHGFSNRTLWPLFHSFPGRTNFDRREWDFYDRVNERFAQAATKEWPKAGLIWVHDYQLMMTPLYLRQMMGHERIAFFLHIPFPPYDLFRLLPWDRELLRGLLACDLIGFHVEGYARNFLDCAERIFGARVDRRSFLVEHGDRTVQVAAFPLGIDFDLYESAAINAPPPAAERRERIVLGVDRLDYTKGIPERIVAFERLLELYPEHREKVVLLQLAVPSRSQVAEYRQLKQQIDELVGRVNGRFATASWSPIRYLYRSVPPERLAAWYRDADVALVTPLRDGMNLVAKEFVACQVDQPGVLVLSRLAGAAETMHEALRVNPYNLDETARALHRALTMEEAERRSRLAALRRRERRYNVHNWVKNFLDAALATQAGIHPPSDADFEAWLQLFLRGYHLALFLDYDGTITPIEDHPAQVELSEPMRKAIEACARRQDTDVSILSGRSHANLTESLKGLPVIAAGNHGLEISGRGVPRFLHQDLGHYQQKIGALAAALEDLTTDGAWIEQKGPTLTFHYRQVERPQQSRLAERARAIIAKAGFQVRDAHSAVEARPPIGWDKGDAVLYILRSRYGPAWSERVRVVYVGDDQTDEDAFRVLTGLGITFRVGSADTLTAASRRLPNVAAVLTLVEWLAQRAGTPIPKASQQSETEERMSNVEL